MSEFLEGFGTDYTNAAASTGGGKPDDLKPGGYVLRIIGCKLNRIKADLAKIVFAFEIAEGDCKDYFKALHEYRKGFDENAKWSGTLELFYPSKGKGTPEDMDKYNRSLSALKAAVTAINESNPNRSPIDLAQRVNLDAFKGLTVGGIFGDVEWQWNGKTGISTKCRWFTSAEKIRSGDFKIPAPKMQNNNSSSSNSFTSNETASTSTQSAQQEDFGEIISDGDVPF